VPRKLKIWDIEELIRFDKEKDKTPEPLFVYDLGEKDGNGGGDTLSLLEKPDGSVSILTNTRDLAIF
jgi:hypothetical protein